MRGLALTLVHVWDVAVELAVDLDGVSVPGLSGPVTCVAVNGSVCMALAAGEPDLLVLGVKEQSRHLTRQVRAVLLQAHCPVVLVPAEPSARDRVVVGVCGTPASAGALRWAAQEARLRDAELVVLYAWQVQLSVRSAYRPSRRAAEQGAAAVDRLRGWVDAVLGLQHAELTVIRGPQLEALLEASAGADLLVLGRGRHSWLNRLATGMLAADVGALASCPVAVIPVDSAQVSAGWQPLRGTAR